MPKETFWDSSLEETGHPPVLTVAWGGEQPAVTLNDVEFDRSEINRLIRDLVRARNATWGADEGDSKTRTVTIKINADTSDFTEAIERLKRSVKDISPLA